MEPSRLKLETYHLVRISITPHPDAEAIPLGQVADFENLEFSSEVTFHDLKESKENDSRQGLSLAISVKRGEAKDFPYQIEMEMFGVFDANGFPEEKRVPLVLVNGASLLYSAMREMLLSTTQRCLHGPVMLPSVHFTRLEKDYLAEQSKTSTEIVGTG